MDDDAIDFPCAPCWVTHYAKQGLTTDYPPEYYFGESMAVLERRIDALERQNSELQRQRRPERNYQEVRAHQRYLQQQIDAMRQQRGRVPTNTVQGVDV